MPYVELYLIPYLLQMSFHILDIEYYIISDQYYITSDEYYTLNSKYKISPKKQPSRLGCDFHKGSAETKNKDKFKKGLYLSRIAAQTRRLKLIFGF